MKSKAIIKERSNALVSVSSAIKKGIWLEIAQGWKRKWSINKNISPLKGDRIDPESASNAIKKVIWLEIVLKVLNKTTIEADKEEITDTKASKVVGMNKIMKTGD